jgi:hypothetical protein
MTEELPRPIGRELQNTFGSAIVAYRDWGRGQPEPKVFYKQTPVAISFVCDLAMTFEDEMPDPIWNLLLETARGSDEWLKDRKFSSGGRCLAQLIREKEESFNQPS